MHQHQSTLYLSSSYMTFVFVFLLNYTNDLSDQCLELILRHFSVSICIEILQKIIDILIWRLLNVESVSKSFHHDSQFVSFDVTWVVSVEIFETLSHLSFDMCCIFT